MPKVTLQAIAEAAGVSKYAVSRALAGKPGVSDATRIRINELAKEMGYRRTTSAASKTLAVLCEDADMINGEVNQKIMSGIRDEAHRSGFDLIELQTTGARRLSDVADRTDGLIFVGVNRPEVLDAAAKLGVPLVKVGTFDLLEQSDIVRGTNYENGRVIGEMLLQKGHRKLVFVRGRRDFRGRQERFNGFKASTFHTPDATVYDLRWTDSDDLDKQLTALLAEPDPATAFFCAHDGLAVTIMSELLTRNIRIPQDASLIGHGDYVTAQHVRPPLTTIRTPGTAFGREAVRLLKDRMENPDNIEYRVRIQIPSEIIMRDTVGVCRKR